MAARAIWKGVLRLGASSVPVKLYSAVEDRNVHFHLLHDQDLVRVTQRMVNPRTNQTVPYQQIRKGYEVERDRFVMLEPEELESLEPTPSRDIEISKVVPTSVIDHQWYDRPYFLGPDGDEQGYFALAQALEAEDKEGLAHWAMRKKAYSGALRAAGGYLALITLLHSGEVISPSELDPPAGRALDDKEMKLAQQLVAALEDDFHPEDFQEEYRSRVMQLIDTKRRGGKVEPEKIKKKPKTRSLVESLQASLAGAK